MPPLTDAACKNAKPGAKPLRLFDSGGLFLLVTSNSGKWWRFKYRFEGKEKLLSWGVYPDVALGGHKDKQTGLWIDGARDKRDQARKLLASGTDPGAVRKTEKAEKLAANANTFEAVAREWHSLPKRKGNRAWSAETAAAGRLVDKSRNEREPAVFPYESVIGCGHGQDPSVVAVTMLTVLQAGGQ